MPVSHHLLNITPSWWALAMASREQPVISAKVVESATAWFAEQRKIASDGIEAVIRAGQNPDVDLLMRGRLSLYEVNARPKGLGVDVVLRDDGMPPGFIGQIRSEAASAIAELYRIDRKRGQKPVLREGKPRAAQTQVS